MLRDQLRLVVVLLALLAAAVGWWSWRAAPAPAPGQVRVADVRVDQIRTIAVHGITSWRIERAEDRWWVVVGADRWPADPTSAHELADAVVEAAEGLPVPDAAPDDIGLDHAIRVEVAAQGVWRFEVGDDAPVGRRTWIRVEGAGVLAVQGGIGVAVRAAPGDMVQRALWAGESLDTVTLEGPQGTFIARRDAAGWSGGPSAGATETWAQAAWDLSFRSFEVVTGAPTHRMTMVGGGATLGAELGRGPGGWWLRAEDGRAGLLDADLDRWVGGFRQEP